MKLNSIIVMGIVVAIFLGCGENRDQAASGKSIIVFAAASTTDVMKELGKAFAKQNSGTKVLFNFASSGTLAKQINAGAEADVYVSANVKWMDFLEQHKRIKPESRFNFARNELVLIAPKSTPFKAEMRPEMNLPEAFEGFLAVGEFKSVPAGTYAEEGLTTLGWLDDFENRLVAGSDVRRVLMYVASGEASAGIVYGTDAKQSESVVIAGTFPQDTHKPIIYPAAMVAGVENSAAEFVEFLKSEKAENIIVSYGFIPFYNVPAAKVAGK